MQPTFVLSQEIEIGVGLIQLLKWIIKDELEMGQVAHLIPQTKSMPKLQVGIGAKESCGGGYFY